MTDGQYIASFVAFVAVLVTVLILGSIALASARCAATWRESGVESDFGALSGCRVKVGGRWIPASSVREIDIRRNEKAK